MRHRYLPFDVLAIFFALCLLDLVHVQQFTGKKSKKSKWIKADMGVILAEPTTISTTNNWADSVDDESKYQFECYF